VLIANYTQRDAEDQVLVLNDQVGKCRVNVRGQPLAQRVRALLHPHAG
jgi:hypothetical protein